MQKPELEYNIANTELRGNVDGTQIHCFAYAGGRGGSKIPGAVHDRIVNNPFLTGLKHDKKGTIGGPLPIGIYTLQLHESKENWIRLLPKEVVSMHNRSGFAIHGRGNEGSQGCIVPHDFSIVQTLCRLVKNRKEQEQPPITLKVYATGDLDFYLRKLSIV